MLMYLIVLFFLLVITISGSSLSLSSSCTRGSFYLYFSCRLQVTLDILSIGSAGYIKRFYPSCYCVYEPPDLVFYLCDLPVSMFCLSQLRQFRCTVQNICFVATEGSVTAIL